MKRRIYAVVAVLVGMLAVFAATAQAVPAPKTTGDIGYTAYTDVQRHLTFNAIQSTTNTCGTFWDVTGVTSLSFDYPSYGTYVHDATLAQTGQSVSGSGAYTGVPTNTWVVNPGSTVVGNTLTLTWNYTTPPDLVAPTQVVMSMVGTIAADGSISGTWSQTGGAAGTFTAPSGTAAATAIYCGKGTAYYSDASGLWYLVNVTAVSVSGDSAWFAGPVIASNFGAEGNWLFVKVYDGGEPGKLVDEVWGSFATQSAALAGVGDHTTPADGPFTITSGNLQVH